MAPKTWHIVVVLSLCGLFCCKTQTAPTLPDENLQPCTYNGTSIVHGDTFEENKCVICECYNSTIRCDETFCFQSFCSRPLTYTDECCDMCPFDVPVYDVSIREGSIPAVKAGVINNIKVFVDISVNDHGQPAEGINLWKVGMWVSANPDGSGAKLGFVDQVLAENKLEASKPLHRLVPFGGLRLSFQPEYTLDVSNVSCEELKYLCASFKKNELAITRHGIHIVPFNVYGVKGEYDPSFSVDKLVGCRPFTHCNDHVTQDASKGFQTSNCFYNGAIISHGDRLKIDRCTTCACDNGTTSCDKQSCRPPRCSPGNPVYLAGECCSVCPFSVPVYAVAINPVKAVKAGTINEMSFGLNLRVNEGGHWLIEGNGLWKVGVWASSSADGSGNKIGFIEQVLTRSQAADSLLNFAPFAINGIYFHINTTGATCEEVRYLCASFNRGDSPQLLYRSRVWSASDVGFEIYGVEAVNDYTPNAARISTCRRFTSCKDHGQGNGGLTSEDQLPCSFRGNAIYHGEKVNINSCISCECNNSRRHCLIESCPSLFCSTPLTFDDECCGICPYDVPVSAVGLLDILHIFPGTKNDIAVDLQVSVTNRGQQVEGKHLWKVNMWASSKADGSGNTVGYTTQVLNNIQASTPLISQPFENIQFTIPGISFQLDTTGTTCADTQYLCASFNRGDFPEPIFRSHMFSPSDVKFHIYGIEPNGSFNASRLTGCSAFMSCGHQKTVYNQKHDQSNHRIWQSEKAKERLRRPDVQN